MDFPDLIDPSDLGIQFFFEEVTFDWDEVRISNWLEAVVQEEGKMLQSIRLIFCTDDFLHQMNLDYLQHDTLTDVITFPFNSKPAIINGEIYISIDRIRENASTYTVPFEQELTRVVVHGVLHLCGYGDKEVAEKEKMTQKENFYLASNIFSYTWSKQDP